MLKTDRLNVFIIGSGLLGSHLYRFLTLIDGINPCIVSRDASGTRNRLGLDTQVIGSLDSIYDTTSVDYIVNLTGASLTAEKWTPARKIELAESRMQPLRDLATWLKNHPDRKPRKIITASHVAYYGFDPDDRQGKTRPVTEEAPQGDGSWVCELTRNCENEAKKLMRLGGRVVIARMGTVLAKDSPYFEKLVAPIRKGLTGYRKVGTGDQPMSWIHLEDALWALLFMIRTEDTLCGAYNVVAPQVTTQGEFADEVARVLNKRPVVSLPENMARAMSGEMADLVLKGRHVAPAVLQNEGFQFRFPTLRQALVDLLVKK